MRVAGIAVACVLLAACTTDDLGSQSQALVDPSAFTLPMLSAAERATIVHAYDALDPGDEVPRGLLEDAIVYFDVNKPLIPKTDRFVVVDMSRYSGKDRFWLVDLASGAVETHKVAHGDGSDPDNNGYATLFGNTDGSHMTSLGFYLTGEVYDGTHPHSMRLDGLSADGSPNKMANTNVRDRLIVMHPADYVDDANTSQQGRSNGCLALDPAIEVSVVDRIHDGSLIYAATEQLNAPVGRGMPGDGSGSGSGSDMGPGDGGGSGMGEPPGHSGGCAAGGGGSLLLVLLVLLALSRAGRSRAGRRPAAR